MLLFAFRRVFFWLFIFVVVVFTIKNLPDKFQEAAVAYRDGNYVEAMRLWRKMARKGDVAAQYNMGALYATGQGADRSDEQAHDWFFRAALAGNPAAQYETAKNFEFGRGVDASMPETINWLKKSAQQGYAPAQIDLGLKYLTGKGLARNVEVAQRWFERATGPDRKPPIIYGLNAASAVTGKPCDDC